MTQEVAAEHLNISVESIRAYETNWRVVESMVICYNAQHLAYQHLQENNGPLEQTTTRLPAERLDQTGGGWNGHS